MKETKKLKLSTDVYIWIGTTNKNEEEYYKYFEIDYKEDIDSQSYKPCQFCKDIGEKWYDEDFIFLPEPLEKEVSIEKLLEDSIVLDIGNVIKECHRLGIKKANAMFGYATPDGYSDKSCLHISTPYKNSYNDLKFIGKFLHN